MRIRTQIVACVAILGASAAALVSGMRFTNGPGGSAPDLSWLPGLPAAESPRAVSRVSPFGQGPARFEPNAGQAPSGTLWLRRGPHEITHLADDGFTTVVRGRFPMPLRDETADVPHAVRVTFVGSAPVASAAVTGEDRLDCRTNYFVGADPSTWLRDVPSFSRVRYAGVWPGIDVVFHGRDGRMEYDFLVAPGADPDAIALDVEGADAVRIDEAGDLVLDAGPAEIRHVRPVVWQETPEGRRRLACAFALEDGTRVRFRVEGRDASRATVIDPQIQVSSRTGGTGNDAMTAVASAPDGGIVAGGITFSPILVGIGPLAESREGPSDGFVLRYGPGSATATAAVALDIIGGLGDDGVTDIRCAGNGEIFASLYSTDSSTCPRVGGPDYAGLVGVDAYFMRLTADAGTILTAFPFGGAGSDLCTSLDVLRPAGNLTVTNVYAGVLTDTQSFPGVTGITPGRNAVVLRFDPDGTQSGAYRIGAISGITFAPACVSVDQIEPWIFCAASGAPGGFSTTPGAAVTATAALFPGYVARVSRDLAQTHAATFLPGTIESPINSIASVTGTGVCATGVLSSGVLPVTSNAAFPLPTATVFRGYYMCLNTDLSSVLTVTDVRGPSGFTSMSSVVSVTSTSGPVAVLFGQSNGMPAVGGGSSFHGATLGSGPADVVAIVLPAAGGLPLFVTSDGSVASETFSVSSLSQRNVEFGRFGDVLPDGTLAVGYSTTATQGEFELTGGVGGLRDAVLRTVTSTITLPGSVEPEITVDVGAGTLTRPKKPGAAGKATFTFTVADADGERLDLGFGGPGIIAVELSAPISVTGTATLGRVSAPLDSGKLSQRGRVSTFSGKMPDGTRYKITADGRKVPAKVTVSLTGIPAMPLPFGTPLTGVPLDFEVTINDGSGTDVVRGIPASGGRYKFADIKPGVLSRLSVTPSRVKLGQPNTATAHFENPGATPVTIRVRLAHNGFTLLELDVIVPGANPITHLPGIASAAVTAPTPKAGAQPWTLSVDGKIVDKETTTTTK